MRKWIYVMCHFELGNRHPACFYHTTVIADDEEGAYRAGQNGLEPLHPLPNGWGDNDYVIEI